LPLIVFVLSSHGLGHVTRQIALKDELLTLDPAIEILFVLTENQEEMLHDSIHTNDRVHVEYIPITPQLTMEDWTKVDIESTAESFQRFWEWETQIRDDTEWGRILQNADLIINDIECVHNPIATKMRIPIINISNFTWSDILENLGFTELAQHYRSWESLATYNLKLPFSTECKSFTDFEDVGILCRKFNPERVRQIASQSKLPKVLLSYSHADFDFDIVGLIKELDNRKIKLVVHERLLPESFDPDEFNAIVISEGIEDIHNYVAAVDLVISKLGYGIISESITSGTPILYWVREGYYEDEIMSTAITGERGREIEHTISTFDLADLIEKWAHHSFATVQNDSLLIAKKVLSILYSDLDQ